MASLVLECITCRQFRIDSLHCSFDMKAISFLNVIFQINFARILSKYRNVIPFTDKCNQLSPIPSSLPTWNDGYAMAARSTADKRCESSSMTSGSTKRDVTSWSDSATRNHAATRIMERTNDWVNLANQSKQTPQATDCPPKEATK